MARPSIEEQTLELLAAISNWRGPRMDEWQREVVRLLDVLPGVRSGPKRGRPDLSGGQSRAIALIGYAIYRHDPNTAHHSKRVARMAVALARHLGTSSWAQERIFAGGLIHDVGKLAIPKAILAKPYALSVSEWLQMRTHPLRAAECMAELGLFSELAETVRHHHERIDGHGYPDGLNGADLPLEARIVAVCDAYDAMTSLRPYSPALHHNDARAELLRVSGQQLDAELVEALLEQREAEAA